MVVERLGALAPQDVVLKDGAAGADVAVQVAGPVGEGDTVLYPVVVD